MGEQSTENKVHLDVIFDTPSQFTGRSVENGLPVTRPLSNLEDLLAWMPNDPRDVAQSYSIGTVPYYGKTVPKGSTKTLVCHDMAGGYLDDRFVQGCLTTDNKWYYLVYWDIVDTFVYFSHNFITVPPVGWINSAHTNGVAVLGTFITEGDDGFTRCRVIFSCEWIWKRVANQLVEIAKYYRFEGWLLNIENDLDPNDVRNLEAFVKYLTDKMHDAIEGSQVIWYDSVTVDGRLNWQNQLNALNKIYFDACDGIFLNYNWSRDNLKQSAAVAEVTDRVQDVYVGVDVFGRGCQGGGGMNSASALEIIRGYNLSAAIFAPGWTKEVLGAKDFDENQQKFWNYLSRFCNSHAVIADNTRQYLATDFNPGMCMKQEKRQNDGSTKSSRFLHLNRQAQMPCLSNSSFLPLEIGNCNPSRVRVKEDVSVALFKTNLVIKEQGLVIFVALDSGSRVEIQLCQAGCKIRSTKKKTEPISGFPTPSFYEFLEVAPGSVIDEIICKTSRKSTLRRFVLFACGEVDSVFRPLSHDLEIGVTLDDATWKRDDKNPSVILLACTLNLTNYDPTLPIKMYYKSSSDYRELGVSRCGDFRINDLSVPNPVFNGPDTKLTIKAEQSNPTFPFRRPEWPPRVGELTITYGENMPVPNPVFIGPGTKLTTKVE